MKRVIVTGASSGIGRATALLAADSGFEVIAIARRADRLRELSETVGRVVPLPLDVTGDLSPLVATLQSSDPLPLALVNAAGIAEFGDFAEVDPRAMIEVNLVAPMRMIQAILPLMRAAGEGQVINILSIAATTVFPGAAAYAASKAGLLMAARCLSAEVRTQGIRVTSILPGAVDTPIWEGQGFVPAREDMLKAEAVAHAVVDILKLPTDRSVDELVLMPPKGVL